jgi:hypothetical protein
VTASSFGHLDEGSVADTVVVGVTSVLEGVRAIRASVDDEPRHAGKRARVTVKQASRVVERIPHLPSSVIGVANSAVLVKLGHGYEAAASLITEAICEMRSLLR